MVSRTWEISLDFGGLTDAGGCLDFRPTSESDVRPFTLGCLRCSVASRATSEHQKISHRDCLVAPEASDSEVVRIEQVSSASIGCYMAGRGDRLCAGICFPYRWLFSWYRWDSFSAGPRSESQPTHRCRPTAQQSSTATTASGMWRTTSSGICTTPGTRRRRT